MEAPVIGSKNQSSEELIRIAWNEYEAINPQGFKINGASTIADFVKKLADGRFLSDISTFAYFKRHGIRFTRPDESGSDDSATALRFTRFVFFM